MGCSIRKVLKRQFTYLFEYCTSYINEMGRAQSDTYGSLFNKSDNVIWTKLLMENRCLCTFDQIVTLVSFGLRNGNPLRTAGTLEDYGVPNRVGVKDIQLHSIKKKCILSENVTFH